MQPNPHRELTEFVLKAGARIKLILMPRGTFKSSVVTVGYPAFRLANNPNLRILITGETQKNSKKFVKEIKDHFGTNQRFHSIFGNWKSSDNAWRDDEFIVNARTAVKKEPSVMASSLEKQTTTGLHFDIIIVDDPVSLANINTPEQIQKTIDYFRMLLSVLEPNGEIIVIGTRYSPLDLYGHLIDLKFEEGENIDILIKEAINDEGKPNFPEILSEEFLLEQKRLQGDFTFFGQYLNRPVSPETCIFRQDDIQFFDKPPDGLVYFITLDPAVSKKERSDFTAIIVNGVDNEHNYFVLEAFQAKLNPTEIIETVFQFVEQYPPDCVAMERHTLEQILLVNFHYEMDKRKVFFPIKDLPTDTRIAKATRIRALQPRFQAKKIFIKREHKELQYQIINYPAGCKNDDLLDALKSQLQITYPSPFIPFEEKKCSIPAKDMEMWDKMRKETKSRHVKRTRFINM